MSIFSTIVEKIFHSGAAPDTTASHPSSPHFLPTLSGTSESGQPDLSAKTVDVNAVLSEMATKNHEKLNYKESIVDLMKLLDLDSSLAARKNLASELHYTGDTHDSAKMNTWLSKQVMDKLASNGGKMPSTLA